MAKPDQAATVTVAPWLAGAATVPPASATGATASASAEGNTNPPAASETTPTGATASEPAVEVASEVVDMVTVTAPRGFKLRIDNFHEKQVYPGVQEMERCHAEHWYSIANGVTIYNPKAG